MGVGYELLSPGGSPTASFQSTPTEPTPPEGPAAPVDHPRYRVVRWLGSGGMGSVFLAEHRMMERSVALKVINLDLTDHAGVVERFGREVRAAARLQHPNIVTAFDAEQAGSIHILVMEFVEGSDLARLVKRRGPLPVAIACDYIRQAALGLQHAFEHGMVHRDIKPQNLMWTRRGHVKILDFGLALFASEVNSGGFTGTGAMLGTADYVAPEQADDAHTADIRADIYSLGCTLYFLLAGHPPFPGGSLLQKLKAHAERSPRRMAEIRKDLPHDLERVLDRMLAKDPEHRYPSPAEVAEALTPFTKKSATDGPSGSSETIDDQPGRHSASRLLPSGSADPGPDRPPWRFRTPVLATLALLVVIGGALLALAASRNRADRREPNGRAVATSPAEPGKALVANPPPPPPPPATTVAVALAPGPVPTPLSPPPTVDSSKPVPNAPGPHSPDPVPVSIPGRDVPVPRRTPDDVLRGKGLRRVGVVYQLEDEARVERESHEVQALRDDLENRWNRLSELGSQIEQLTFQLDGLLGTPPPVLGTFRVVTGKESKEERDQIESQNRLIDTQSRQDLDRFNLIRQSIGGIQRRLGPLTTQRQELTLAFDVKMGDFQLRQQSLQGVYNSLAKRYEGVRRDPEVEAALLELNKTAQPKFVLGPVQDYSHYRKLVAVAAAQTLRFKGLVASDKGGRLLLASELAAKTQGVTLRLALEKLDKAGGVPRKAATGPELEARRKKTAEELARATLPTQKSQLKAQLDFLNKQIQLAQKLPAPLAPDTPDSSQRAVVLKAVVDLLKTAEAVRRQRASLSNDQEVKDAIAEMNLRRKPADRVRVDAVPEAEQALKLLETTQKSIGIQEVPVKRTGGATLVDAALDGVPATGLVVDTEAAGLRLSEALAAHVGVTPTPDAATVPVRLDDGRTVTARRAALRSLKIGTVELANVPCLILPAEAGDLSPSLGIKSLGPSAAYLDAGGPRLYLASFSAIPADRP